MIQNTSLEPASERIGDLERDAICELLGRHYAAGRLSTDEMHYRTAEALRATTRTQLNDLVADLPRLGPTFPPEYRFAAAGRIPSGPRPSQLLMDIFVGFLTLSAAVCLIGLLLITIAATGFGIFTFLAAFGSAVTTSGIWYFTTKCRTDLRYPH